jgi:3D (Asp-Asp-Asp) domain-containing protein/peptidoglycan hydrolase CwlO-like protein
LLTLAGASAALAANAPSRTQRLRDTAQRLDSRAHQALLQLYALDSRLHAARVRVASLEANAARLRLERAGLRQELTADRATLKVSQRELALRLRALYEQGTVDPVAVLFGAASLGKGLQRLDDLSRLAAESRSVVKATRAARWRLRHARVRLAQDARRLAGSLTAARTAERRLEGAAAARLGYISSLRSQAQLQRAQLQTIVKTAKTAQQKSQKLSGGSPPPPPASGRKMVVSATCYDLPGHTATGMPVGWGVVAVDPTVIPLGTKLYIPGYGNGVAADVGGGIKGRIIDLWMTPASCASWGRRTVTITIL